MNKILPRLTFLGMGTGFPLVSKKPSSLLCEFARATILIDIGLGILHRLLEIGRTPFDISIICLTHFYVDHVADLASFLFALPHSLPHLKPKIIGGPGLQAFIQNLILTYHLAPYSPQSRYEIVGITPGDTLEEILPEGQIQTAAMCHKPESLAYRFQGEVDFVDSGDTDYCDALIDLAQNTELLICEASFPSFQKQKGHLTPQLAGTIATKANAQKLALTHFYPITLATDIEKDCQKTYSKEIIAPSDGTQLRWSAKGKMTIHEILSD